MTNASITRRLEHLESVSDGSGTVVVMRRNDNEDDGAAEVRWHKDHPGELIPAAALRVVIISFDNDHPSIAGGPL